MLQGTDCPPSRLANCNPGAGPRPRMTGRMNDVIDPDGAYCFAFANAGIWYSSEMVRGQGVSAYWTMGHGLFSPDPRGHRCIAAVNYHKSSQALADERADAEVVVVVVVES